MTLPTSKETMLYLLDLFGQQNMDLLITKYAIKYDVSITDIVSKSRKAQIVKVRAKIVKDADQYFTREQIAEALNRDHSSITHLINDYRAP